MSAGELKAAITSVEITSVDGKMNLSKWPAANGFVATLGRHFDDKQVIHLINFKNSTTNEWRDPNGIQSIPATIKDAQVELKTSEDIKKIWIASPDFIGGVSREINFKQIEDKVFFTLPELKYWTMVVVEL